MRFGTDGIRGPAFEAVTPDLVARIGRAAASVLGGPSVLIGADTRESGPVLAAALAAGVAATGAEPVWLGVVPTPAVAHLCAVDGVAGAVVSASHNPWSDNGVKVFGPGGCKLDDDEQSRIEQALATGTVPEPLPAVPPPRRDRTATYRDHLVASIEGRRLDGMRVVLDAANGAASAVAPSVFEALGCTVDAIFDQPDGRNINAGCGSTHLGPLVERVVSSGADLGLAFDGDADRVLAVDATGAVVDGDLLLAIFAPDLRTRGCLRGETVVVTVMTNLGFHLAMAEHAISVEEVPVGDRHVLAALQENGWSLGGEQSGHIIFRDLATTGDGILTGLQLCDVLARSGRPLEVLARRAMIRLPQVLRSVAGTPATVDALAADVERVRARLGATGRVLVRASGTEPVVRVMVEAPTPELAEEAVEDLVTAVERIGSAPAPPL